MRSNSLGKQFNNLAELRLIFALFVVISHTVQLARIDSLYVLRVVFSSDTAVHAFFILSGFLTVNSFESSRQETVKFYLRRFLRIMPAYTAAVLIFCAMGLAQAISFNREIALLDVGRYLAANLSLLNFFHPNIEGVFTGNPYSEINGALWTIKVEVAFYIFVPLLCMLGSRISFLTVAILLISIGITWVPALQLATDAGLPVHSSLGHQLPGQLAYFGLGVLLFWVSRAKDRDGVAVAVITAGTLACAALGQYHVAIEIVVLSMLIYGAIHIRQLIPGTSPDLSYGIYLCHFPIIQLLVNWRQWQEHEQYLLLLIVPIVAFAYAMASWRFIEAPAMKLGKRMATNEARHRSA